MEGAERFRVLIEEGRLQARIAELGAQIAEDYRGKDLVLVCVLKGAVVFLSDLSRRIDLPLAMDFLALSSYGDRTETSGVVQITQDLTRPIEGRDVLVVEDIVDTGLTLDFLLENFRVRHPRSLRVCTLLHKPSHTRRHVPLDYVGFVIEDRFVVGYGLDYEQKYRNLPYIGFLDR
ncbi:MAG: hypoxanthine phosphoribosyltransferase [Deltaproteobacteria bacterium]|nr:hypoxanthine phosphoribosyltransferase [Deltaproteobacteria bacterium]